MNRIKNPQTYNWIMVAVRFILLVSQIRAAYAGERPAFVEVVNRCFGRWTDGNNKVLTSQKVNELVLRTDVKGSEAAAIAAIHAYQKKGGHDATPLTREILVARHPENSAIRRDLTASGVNVFQNYKAFAKHIQSAPRRVFAVEKPSLDTMTQGNLGDCYFVAAVGAQTQTEPDQLLKMIRVNKDHSFDVHFPCGKRVTVPALTDAQLALGSNAGQQGVWLNVLELAAGIVRNQAKKTNDELPLDTLGSGGDSAFSIRLLTGHKAVRHVIRPSLEAKHPAPPEKDVHEIAVRFAKLIREGLNHKRIICCSTGDWQVPPGLIKIHEYTILGIKHGRVDVWNPWGYKYNFEPKGTPGMKNGYYVEGGRCSIPLHDFVKIFGRVTIENVPEPNSPASQIVSTKS